MISLEEAATRLGLSPETIEDWAKKGLLPVLVDEEQLAHVSENL